jgi:beta-lactam-binding protein with PASTA domain
VFEKLFKKSLVFNILAGILLSAIVLFLFLQTLKFWTSHGQQLIVPDITGKTFNEAKIFLEKQGFKVEIQDTVFHDNELPLSVIKQFPDPEATVKVNRTIYLTINNGVAPLVDMPNLVGMSYRTAELELRAKGLNLGKITYVPDLAKNAVKSQLFNSAPIRAGSKIAVGSSIDLELGSGLGAEEIPVPDLFGLPYPEAAILLEASGVSMGVVLLDANLTDTSAGFVYWQNPSPIKEDKQKNTIRSGQLMDIRLALIKPISSIDSVTNYK